MGFERGKNSYIKRLYNIGRMKRQGKKLDIKCLSILFNEVITMPTKAVDNK